MKVRITLAAMLLLVAGAAQAQYKYIGPDGKVVYSDQPPPPNAKVLDRKPLSGSGSSVGDLPFAVQNPARNFPVTLYTAPNCGTPCSEGRNMLTQRGIPFTEKTVKTAEDAAAFQKEVNSSQVPVLAVGKDKQTQFDRDAWNSSLDAAGYPSTNQLPKDYKNPAPTGMVQTASAPTPPAGQAGAAGTAPPAAPPADAGGDKPAWFKGF